MLTIAFIVLKFTDVLLLSWWWVILAIIIDGAISNNVSSRIMNSYETGLEDGVEAFKEEHGLEALD